MFTMTAYDTHKVLMFYNLAGDTIMLGKHCNVFRFKANQSNVELT